MQNNESTHANDLPLACLLSSEQMAIRTGEIREIFASHQQVRELTDGYSFQYPGKPFGLKSCCTLFWKSENAAHFSTSKRKTLH